MVKCPPAYFKRGFTLLEVMVAVVLFTLVMLLLFRGVTAVTTTVTLGQRQSSLQRNLKDIRRVMEGDFESMVVHPHWPVYLSEALWDEEAPSPQMVFAFLRYSQGSAGPNETEWVQYWREPYPDAEFERLSQWVRYAGPAIHRRDAQGAWWDVVTPDSTSIDSLEGEILADELIAVDLSLQTATGPQTGVMTQQVEAIDVKIFVSTTPIALVPEPEDNPLLRMWQEDGAWMHFRSRPHFGLGSPMEPSL